MKIDAHQHFWQLHRGDYDWLTADLGAIYRDFIPTDLLPYLQEAGITGTILVQATNSEEETEYLLKLADEFDWIFGVVGWVDMEAKSAPKIIARFAGNKKFCGIRPMIQGITDDEWMLRPNLHSAIKTLIKHNLTFDALILPRHLLHLQKFLQMYPDLPAVIDHGAKPQIRAGIFQPWADNIQNIAENSKALCKLSGLITEANADWQVQDILPYAQHILKCFGAQRVMFGSDWPVVNLAGDYQKWYQLAMNICASLNPQEQDHIFGLTAKKFYGV